jgi:hypothetical protein
MNLLPNLSGEIRRRCSRCELLRIGHRLALPRGDRHMTRAALAGPSLVNSSLTRTEGHAALEAVRVACEEGRLHEWTSSRSGRRCSHTRRERNPGTGVRRSNLQVPVAKAIASEPPGRRGSERGLAVRYFMCNPTRFDLIIATWLGEI